VEKIQKNVPKSAPKKTSQR